MSVCLACWRWRVSRWILVCKLGVPAVIAAVFATGGTLGTPTGLGIVFGCQRSGGTVSANLFFRVSGWTLGRIFVAFTPRGGVWVWQGLLVRLVVRWVRARQASYVEDRSLTVAVLSTGRRLRELAVRLHTACRRTEGALRFPTLKVY